MTTATVAVMAVITAVVTVPLGNWISEKVPDYTGEEVER